MACDEGWPELRVEWALHRSLMSQAKGVGAGASLQSCLSILVLSVVRLILLLGGEL